MRCTSGFYETSMPAGSIFRMARPPEAVLACPFLGRASQVSNRLIAISQQPNTRCTHGKSPIAASCVFQHHSAVCSSRPLDVVLVVIVNFAALSHRTRSCNACLCLIGSPARQFPAIDGLDLSGFDVFFNVEASDCRPCLHVNQPRRAVQRKKSRSSLVRQRARR